MYHYPAVKKCIVWVNNKKSTNEKAPANYVHRLKKESIDECIEYEQSEL